MPRSEGMSLAHPELEMLEAEQYRAVLYPLGPWGNPCWTF